MLVERYLRRAVTGCWGLTGERGPHGAGDGFAQVKVVGVVDVSAMTTRAGNPRIICSGWRCVALAADKRAPHQDIPGRKRPHTVSGLRPPARESRSLIFRPLFRPRGSADAARTIGGIDDQYSKYGYRDIRLEDPPNRHPDAPSTDARNTLFQARKRLRKSRQGETVRTMPQHAFPNIRFPRPVEPFLVRPADAQRRHPLPRRVAQTNRSIKPKTACPKASGNLICS